MGGEWIFLQTPAQLYPIDLRHHDIANNDVRPDCRGYFKRAVWGDRFEHFITFGLEQILKQIKRYPVVVNDQNCWGIFQLSVHQGVCGSPPGRVGEGKLLRAATHRGAIIGGREMED